MKIGSMMGAAAVVALMMSSAAVAEPLRSADTLPTGKVAITKHISGNRAAKTIAKDDHLVGPFAIIFAIFVAGAIGGGIYAASNSGSGG